MESKDWLSLVQKYRLNPARAPKKSLKTKLLAISLPVLIGTALIFIS